MKFAYADPPYIGQSKRHYADHPDYKGEVDHRKLLMDLKDNYPDGWVLSLSSPTLYEILKICDELNIKTRVGVWVKPWAVWTDKNVSYAWEPILWSGGRKRNWRTRNTARDWVSANAVMNRKNDPNNTKGTKPRDFCFWIFDILGAERKDTLIDIFPGSGAVSEYWEQFIKGYKQLS